MEERKWWAFLYQEQRYHGFVRQDRSQYYHPDPLFRDQKNYPYIDPYRAAIADQLATWNIAFTPVASFWIRSSLTGWRPGEMRAAFQVGKKLFLHVHRTDFRQQRSDQERSTSFHERDRRRFLALYLLDQRSDQHKVFTPVDFEREGPLARDHGISYASISRRSRWRN